MKKYELTEKDFNVLRRLLVVSRSIINSYYALVALEYEGKKNSLEYEMIKIELNTALEMEKELYKNFNSSKAKSLIKYLVDDEIDFENYLYLIFNSSYEEMIKLRIISRLEYIMYNNDMSDLDIDGYPVIDLEDEEDSEKIEYYEDNRETFISESDFEIVEKIGYSIETDIVNTILKILQEHIDNPFFNSIKYSLIEFKYLLSLVFSDIESAFLENNFEINDSLNWTSTFYADLYGIEQDELQIFKSIYSDDLLEENRTTLISILDKLIEEIPDIQDSDYFVDATISEIIIRACLLFVSPDEMYNYVMLIENDLEQIESKNDGVEPIVRMAIDSYNEDKKLPIILGLKRND